MPRVRSFRSSRSRRVLAPYTEASPEPERRSPLQRFAKRCARGAGEWQTYGYRRLTAELCRAGWEANHKRVRRAMADLGIAAKNYRRRPGIHHWDQRIRFAARAYVQALLERGVAVSMAAVGQPRENGHAERLIRTIKEEEVDLTEYEDYGDAYGQTGRFLDEVYQRKRIHSALG